jgi:hypothetical protein
MDEEKPFTVRDRRKFTAEGDLRNDAEQAEPAPAVSPAPPAPPAEPPAGPAAVREHPPGDRASAVGRLDLTGFLVSLATQASMLLTTPEGDVRENLQGAQHLIDVLEMLEDKTRGNRSDQEEEVLRQILYELRMAFVERSRTVGA